MKDKNIYLVEWQDAHTTAGWHTEEEVETLRDKIERQNKLIEIYRNRQCIDNLKGEDVDEFYKT